MGTLARDEHIFLASEIFSLPYLQRPAAVRFGDSAALSFQESDKMAQAAWKGKRGGKGTKGRAGSCVYWVVCPHAGVVWVMPIKT